ncbi:MAG: L-histidine N(alpha)-methyltransferase [Bacteroidota bacterium]
MLTSHMDIATKHLPFLHDVQSGLGQFPKRLPSKYFYDDIGSQIFQEIMEMPEYYLTNAEHEILRDQAAELIDAVGFAGQFSLVELGAGDGAKTKSLLQHLVDRGRKVVYRPVDISAKAVELLEADFRQDLPELEIQSLVGDYFEVLEAVDLGPDPALFLFLGSNIGNYETPAAIELLQHFGEFMRPGDKMLVGFDLKKQPETILKAYGDPHGITARFNLNLLTRMNRELGTNFDPGQFLFYPSYNPHTGEVRSCLVSLVEQSVYLPATDQTFSFNAFETIATELSKKYSLREIEALAEQSGFRFHTHVLDSRRYFSDSLWEK